jgi:hypothetical protein
MSITRAMCIKGLLMELISPKFAKKFCSEMQSLENKWPVLQKIELRRSSKLEHSLTYAS